MYRIDLQTDPLRITLLHMKPVRQMITIVALAMWAAGPLRADQVVMQNGDTYGGKVLSLTTNSLVLQNENLGNITLPRSKIASIILGILPAATNSPVARPLEPAAGRPASVQTNFLVELSAAFRGLRDQTNLIQQVKSQILDPAGPEAAAKFNELLDGLGTGKIGLSDLRAEARSAADQLRSLKTELGPEVSAELESYLVILDGFLKETAPVSAATNSSRTVSPAKPDKARVDP